MGSSAAETELKLPEHTIASRQASLWGSAKTVSGRKEASEAQYSQGYSLYVRWLTTGTTLSTHLSAPMTDRENLLIIWEPFFFLVLFFLTKNEPILFLAEE